MGTGGLHPDYSIESGEPGCCFKPAGPAARSLPPLRPPLLSKLPTVSERPSQGLQQPICVFSFCVRASMPAHDTASRQFLGKLTCPALLNHYSLELHLSPPMRQPPQQEQLGNWNPKTLQELPFRAGLYQTCVQKKIGRENETDPGKAEKRREAGPSTGAHSCNPSTWGAKAENCKSGVAWFYNEF